MRHLLKFDEEKNSLEFIMFWKSYENMFKITGFVLFTVKQLQVFESLWVPTIVMSTVIPYFGYKSADHALGTENVQNFMRRKDLHFDLVIHEEIYHDSFLIFGYRFRSPVVSICKYKNIANIMLHWILCNQYWSSGPLGIMELFDQDMGLITPSSHVSHTMLTYTDNMSFIERYYSSMLTLYDWVLHKIAGNPLQNMLLRKHFDYLGPLPSIDEMRKNISLTFVNAHRSITPPRPSMPGLFPNNVVFIGL